MPFSKEDPGSIHPNIPPDSNLEVSGSNHPRCLSAPVTQYPRPPFRQPPAHHPSPSLPLSKPLIPRTSLARPSRLPYRYSPRIKYRYLLRSFPSLFALTFCLFTYNPSQLQLPFYFSRLRLSTFPSHPRSPRPIMCLHCWLRRSGVRIIPFSFPTPPFTLSLPCPLPLVPFPPSPLLFPALPVPILYFYPPPPLFPALAPPSFFILSFPLFPPALPSFILPPPCPSPFFKRPPLLRPQKPPPIPTSHPNPPTLPHLRLRYLPRHRASSPPARAPA